MKQISQFGSILTLEISTFIKQYLCTWDFFSNLLVDHGWLLGCYYMRLLFKKYENQRSIQPQLKF